VSGCSEPERSQLASDDFELQARDAARMLDLEPRSLPATVESLQSASAENTHQPAPPKSVVPAHLRADTGVRHLFSAIGVMIQNLGRLGLPSQIKMLSVATEPLRQSLTLRPLLELVLEDASQWRSRSTLPEDLCERLARLVADRPDLVTWWDRIARCRSQTLLRMVTEMQWSTSTNLPGTGRMPPSAWEASPRTYAGLRREAGRRAPWNQYHIQANLIAEYKGEPPSAAVLKAYEKLLDYDLYAMGAVVFELHDDDDQVQRLSERICDLDVEQCGNYAAYLAILGRDAPAERLWKRALAGARDQITLSNQLGGYVNLLLDRGETAEALRIARRAADVYSGGGLATLALAYERLGRFDDAAREYAKITRRYEDKVPENTFYVRHRQRYGGNAFGRETALAMAELFPKGLLRKALAVFQREGHRGGVGLFQAQLTEPLRRAGLRQEDFLVALDGFAVENQTQMDAVLTFTDEPTLTAIVFRRPSFIEVKGRYHRWKYGLVTGKPPA
jgi:tetratricopeptide (TPR) repeat protein